MSERRASLEKDVAQADLSANAGKADRAGGNEQSSAPQSLCRGSSDSMYTRGKRTQHGKPDSVVGRDDQPEAGDSQIGRYGVAERPVVPGKPGNAGGGKGP